SHQAPGCPDSPPPHLRHSVRTAVRPDSLYFFQGSRRASASDLRHLQHKSRAVGLGSLEHRSVPPEQVSLPAQNTLGRTSPTAIQSLWASPHAPLRCVTQDPLRLQSPPPCPVETSVPSRPTEHEPGHSSLPLPALRRAAWPRVDSVTCPPPRTAAFPAKPMIPVPPIAESLAPRTVPLFARNSPRPALPALLIPLGMRPLLPGVIPPSPAPDSLARPAASP